MKLRLQFRLITTRTNQLVYPVVYNIHAGGGVQTSVNCIKEIINISQDNPHRIKLQRRLSEFLFSLFLTYNSGLLRTNQLNLQIIVDL